MPIDEQTKKFVTDLVRSKHSEMKAELMIAATEAGRSAAILHCTDAHRGLFDVSSRIEAGNIYIIDRMNGQDAELTEIKKIIIESVRRDGVREGKAELRASDKSALKWLMGSSLVGMLGVAARWLYTHLVK